MKTNVLLAFVAAGTLALTSCSKKIDEKTMADINQFGTDWAGLGEKATAWSSDLTTSTQQAHDFASKQHAMAESMATSKDAAMKTKCTEMTTAADQTASSLDAMSTEWTSFKTSWDENTKAYTEWTAKVTKGEVTPEDAAKGLTDWRTKMSDAQAKIDSWGTTLASIKDNCSKNMAMATDLEKSSTVAAIAPTKSKPSKNKK